MTATLSTPQKRGDVEDRPSVPYRLVALLVCAVFLSGLINLVPLPGNLFLATVIVDGLYLVMLSWLALHTALSRRALDTSTWIMALVMLAGLYVVLFAHGSEPLVEKFLNLRSQVLYAFVAVFVYLTIPNQVSLIRLLKLAMRLSVIVAGFGIFQYVFRHRLPEWLLVSRDTEVFSYWGTDVVRTTGLMGNTIVFSSVLLIFFTLHICRLLFNYRTPDLASAAILFIAIILTFSRVAIVGSIALAGGALVLSVLRARPTSFIIRGSIATYLVSLTVLTICALPSLRQSVQNSFIVQGLLGGQNASARESIQMHLQFIGIALDIFERSPWIGLGIASQRGGSLSARTSPVITDGAFWATLAEGGLILVIAYTVVIGTCAVTAIKCWRKSPASIQFIPAAFLIYTAFIFGGASLVNSAYYGKPVFILYWLLFGIVAGLGGRRSCAGARSSPDEENTRCIAD